MYAAWSNLSLGFPCDYDGRMSRPDPIPFDTHRFVKRLTKEGMPTGQAEALADEQISLLNSNLSTKQDLAHLATKDDVARCATKDDLANFATKDDVAKCATKDDLANFATKQDFAVLNRRIDAVVQDVAVLKSEVRTLKWIVSGVGFGMVTLMLGVSSLVVKAFWTV